MRCCRARTFCTGVFIWLCVSCAECWVAKSVECRLPIVPTFYTFYAQTELCLLRFRSFGVFIFIQRFGRIGFVWERLTCSIENKGPQIHTHIYTLGNISNNNNIEHTTQVTIVSLPNLFVIIQIWILIRMLAHSDAILQCIRESPVLK